MAWNLWANLDSSADIQSYEFWREWYLCLREKQSALGPCYFPRMITPWADGTITGATETTITDGDANWVIAAGCSGVSRWVGYGCEGSEHVPSSYDVLIEIDPTDPRKVIRKPITANTENMLTIDSLAINKDLYRQLSGYGELVGKTYRIVRRSGSGYPTWNERWFEAPNKIIDTGNATSSTSGTVTDSSKSYALNELAGCDVIFDAGGLKRRTISGNTADTITFSGMDVISGSFTVIVGGSIYLPQAAGRPFRWYGGIGESALSIYANGGIGGSYHPAPTVTLFQGQTVCDFDTVQALDRDIFTDLDDQCTPEKSFAPDFYKAPIRASQVFLEGICGSFCENKDWTTTTARPIPTLVPATALKLAGINSATTSDVSDAGSVEFSVSLPAEHTLIDLHYALIAPDGSVIESGITTTTGTISATVATPAFDGKTITCVTSRGWTRRIERQVRYVYPRTYWMPGYDEEEEIVDPPADAEGQTGEWVTRPADPEYNEWTEYGYPGSGAAFVTGDYVRYLGHAYHDGVIAGWSITDEAPAELDYFRYAEELLPSGVGVYRASRRGTASEAGSSRHLRDTSKVWWQFGIQRTETGTASSGSTTSLADSSKAASFFWESSRWVGHTVEVEIDGVWHPRLITGHTGTTLTWAGALPASAGSKAYRIVVPNKVLNQWQQRLIRITHAGTEYTSTLRGSNNDVLFFDDIGLNVAAGDAYEILEMEPGQVVRRTATGFESIDNPHGKHPTTATRYGRARNRDFVTPLLLQELKAFANVLAATKTGYAWVACPDNDPITNCAKNYRAVAISQYPHGGGPDVFPSQLAGFKDEVAEAIADPEACTPHMDICPGSNILDYNDNPSVPPQARYGYSADISGEINGGVSRIFKWARLQNLVTCMASEIDLYNFASTDQYDLGEGECTQAAWVPESPCFPWFKYYFAPSGDNVLYRQWKKWDTTGASSQPLRHSTTALGTLTLPSVPGNVPQPHESYDPGPPPTGEDWAACSWVHTYYVSATDAVCRWDVAGGMIYVG